jgi:hypothetical protein
MVLTVPLGNDRNLGGETVPTPSSNSILWYLQDNLNLVGRNGQDRSLPINSPFSILKKFATKSKKIKLPLIEKNK